MQVIIRVAIVMPEIGFDEVPMIPTMREETVTKKKPKTTMRSDIRSDCGKGPCGKFGRIARITTIASDPMSTNPIPRSRSVRFAGLPLSRRRSS